MATPRPPRALTITAAGWFYLVLNAFVLLAAVNSGVNLLYFLFGLFIGGWFVSAIFASVNLRGITLSREITATAIAGEPFEIRYRFHNAKRRWPGVSIFFREADPALAARPSFIPYLPGQKSAHGREVISAVQTTPPHRGILALDELLLSTTFPFGFLRRTRRLRVPQALTVYPRIGMLARELALQYRESLESGGSLSHKRGGQGEFFGIREYRPGDNIRAIHWRSSARTGEVMIRESASSAPPQLRLILNLRHWREISGGAELAERAVELAAAVICWGFQENLAVGLSIAGLEENAAPLPRSGWEARAMLLTRLAELDLGDVGPGGIAFAGKVPPRTQWVVVTLQSGDAPDDLFPAVPPAAPQDGETQPGRTPAQSGGRLFAHRSILAMDAPAAMQWVRFLDPAETPRPFRERRPGTQIS